MSTKEDDNLWLERREALIRHITNVRESCLLLGNRLIKLGENKIGHNLIANGFIHDNSKFYGIEWKYLHGDISFDDPMLAAAVHQHITTNKHHPEYWDSQLGSNDGIHNMPRVYLAEAICDWHARSHEFGNDVTEWVKNQATKKFNMATQGSTYREVKELLRLLLDNGFKQVKSNE